MLEIYLIDVLSKVSCLVMLGVVFILYGLLVGVNRPEERKHWLLFIFIWVILFIFIPIERDVIQLLVQIILRG